MSASPCCPQCGVVLSQASQQTIGSALCASCQGGVPRDASAPWWVEAAQQTPPPSVAPPPLPPNRIDAIVPPTTLSSRRRWYYAAIAAASLFLGVPLVLGLAPRTNTTETARLDTASALSVIEEREIPQDAAEETSVADNELSATALKPALHLFDRPAPRSALRSSSSDHVQLGTLTPPPLPPAPMAKTDAAVKRDAPLSLHCLDGATEEELRRLAATAPEIGLGSSGPTILNAYLNHVPANNIVLATPNLTDAVPLLEVRPDLRMLPINFGDRCKLNGKLTAHLDVLSRRLRIYLDTFNPAGPDGERGGTPKKLHQTLLEEKHGKKLAWLRAEAVPPLLQILMGEETSFRLVLVDLLAKINAPAATIALAQRATFDLSPEVRAAAVAALKDRPAAEYRTVFLKALRYPWAIPAQHAVEALVILKDTGAVPVLVSFLKLPDPAGPLTIHKNRHILQDVVRLNHLNNCMMCHPPASTADEPVLGVDPVVTLPVRMQTPPMIQSVRRIQMGGGGHGSSGPPITVANVGSSQVTVQLPLLIRGDITFLRQDFTVRQPVGTVALQPGINRVRRQRFDYVVRTRILPRAVNARLEEVTANRPSYPQRDAVLFALRELSGKDAGITTEAWLQMFPRAETEVEAARLSRKLVKSEDLDRERLLAQYRDGKGIVYTQALACAISSLRGVAKVHVRGVLTERLSRMSAKTLRDKLQDDDAEIRRAAVLACGRKKEEKQFVPDLIALLDKPEPVTARLAEEGLTSLTGEHFKHPTAWKNWWNKHGEPSVK